MLVDVVHGRLIAIAGTLAIAAIAAIAGVPSGADAAAARSTSSNWAGYVAHGGGVHFRTAFGTWVQPAATCSAGTRTRAAVWVGIGGYPSTSQALEQIGTEVDCTKAGQTRYSAWYELIPAPSIPIAMTVRPGDQMAGRVTVRGHSVKLELQDVTTNASFTKTVYAPNVALGSAEWIVESPAVCGSSGSCKVSQLANFGTTGFSMAGATSTTGHTGAIADPAWSSTALDLVPGRQALRSAPNVGVALPGWATTGDLSASGDAFNVSYRTLTTPVARFRARGRAPRRGR